LSASDDRVHFGVDQTKAVVGIAVRWPGGNSEVWRDINVNQHISLIEGEGDEWVLQK